MSMSSRPKRNGSIEFQVTSVHVAAEEASTRIAARDEEPRRRAYEIYLERGEQPGSELEDWLQAERDERQQMDIELFSHVEGFRAHRRHMCRRSAS